MPRRLCRILLVLALTPWTAGGPSEAAQSPERAPQAEQTAAQGRPPDDPDGVFRAGIQLINVSATVTDARGRFVDGLTRDDFLVYEDGAPVEISQFDNERVPVSLGIALDTSGSMDGRKMEAARHALDRFLYDLLGPDDEFFLYRFDYTPVLLQDWTTSPDRLSRTIREIRPGGGTALYDAVADSVPRVAEGRHRKKALLIISDGTTPTARPTTRACGRSSGRPRRWCTPSASTPARSAAGGSAGARSGRRSSGRFRFRAAGAGLGSRGATRSRGCRRNGSTWAHSAT